MSGNIKRKCTSGARGAALINAALGHAPFLSAKGECANSLPQPLQILFPTVLIAASISTRVILPMLISLVGTSV